MRLHCSVCGRRIGRFLCIRKPAEAFGMFVFSLDICMFSLKIYIFRLEICISRLGIKILAGCIRFSAAFSPMRRLLTRCCRMRTVPGGMTPLRGDLKKYFSN